MLVERHSSPFAIDDEAAWLMFFIGACSFMLAVRMVKCLAVFLFE